MADDRTQVHGLPDLKQALAGIPDKLRRRALRNALAAGAREVRNVARAAAPVISPRDPKVTAGVRAPGTVRDAINVRTSKRDRRDGNVGVFVNVRPARGAVIREGKILRPKEKGANSPKDPFYWRWLEFGRSARMAVAQRSRVQRVVRQIRGRRVEIVKGVRFRRALRAVSAMPAFRFLTKSVASLPRALAIFAEKIGPQIKRLNGGKDVQL